MFKLYKKDNKGSLLYAEAWATEEGNAIIHTGKVGSVGKSDEFVITERFDSEAAFLQQSEQLYKDKGYTALPDSEKYWLVLQYEMKSLKGSKRDHWLKEKVADYLNHDLGWKGLGHVDGFDMGKQISREGKFALNIFMVVCYKEKAIAAVKKCTKDYRLDYTRIKIASRPYDSDESYLLEYSAKKNDQEFSI